jgi:uncharacterized protein
MTNEVNNELNKGGMTVSEAGRKGGKKTAETHGQAFYQSIGKKGGESRKRELGHNGYVDLGRKGGERTAQTHGKDFYQEIGHKGGETVSRERGAEYYQEIGRKGGQKRL